jgi:hypothetical protein
MLVVCGAVLYWHWIRGSGLAAQHMPLVIEAGAATVIAVTTASPFGEPERVTGRWLPYLRPITCVVLAGAAIGALAAGSAALAFTTGIALIAIRGAPDSARE